MSRAYIKTSINKLLPIYVCLFDKVLDSGEINVWSVGLVLPLYKKQGNANDPSNYMEASFY